MNILLTGSTGYIGKNLKVFLARCDGYDITAPSSGELDLTNTLAVEASLRDHHVKKVKAKSITPLQYWWLMEQPKPPPLTFAPDHVIL